MPRDRGRAEVAPRRHRGPALQWLLPDEHRCRTEPPRRRPRRGDVRCHRVGRHGNPRLPARRAARRTGVRAGQEVPRHPVYRRFPGRDVPFVDPRPRQAQPPVRRSRRDGCRVGRRADLDQPGPHLDQRPGIATARRRRSPLHCRAAVREHEQRRGQHLLQPRHIRGVAERPRPHPGAQGLVAHLVVSLCGAGRADRRDRSQARGAPHPRRQRAQERRQGPDNCPTDRCTDRCPPLVADLRSKGPRHLRGPG